MKRLITILFLVVFVTTNIFATRILIPMDEEGQRNHLKAYGIAYWILQNEIEVLKSRFEPEDTGHIRTAVGVLEGRLEEVKDELRDLEDE